MFLEATGEKASEEFEKLKKWGGKEAQNERNSKQLPHTWPETN